MIITFDGHSGAGKTTQSHKIASLLNLKRVALTSLIRITSEFYVGTVERFPWELAFDNVLRNLSTFRGMQQDVEDGIKDLFWTTIFLRS